MVIVVRGRRLLALFALCALAAWGAARAAGPIAAMVASSAGRRLVPIYKVDREEKWVSISFDATWGVDHTDRLLDILDRHGVKTTFFLAGYWVEKYPDYVRKIAERGHELGNHSYEHPHMNSLSKEAIRADLLRNHQLLVELTGKTPILFRPPFGEYSNKVIEVASELGYYTIQWSIDSLDWKDVSADFMVNRVMEQIGPGDIVLFHNAGKHTPEAVERLIPMLHNEGYKIVPISELIYRENYRIESHSGVQRRIAPAGEPSRE